MNERNVHIATPLWIYQLTGLNACPGPFLLDTPNQIERYEGVNSLTGKPVTIEYVVVGDKKLIEVSTFNPDNEYDTNKPYIFFLDPGHVVSYISW